MKLKKLLAGITAAALAVSAMAFSSLTASAADSGITISVFANDGGKSGEDAWPSKDEPLSFTGDTVTGAITWDNIGDDKIKEITGEGVTVLVPGYENAGKAVTFEGTYTISDGSESEEDGSDERKVVSATKYLGFNVWGVRDIVEVSFPIGLTTEDMGKKITLNYTVTYDSSAPAEKDWKVYTINFDENTELSIKIDKNNPDIDWEIDGFDGKDVEASIEGIDLTTLTYDDVKNNIFKFKPTFKSDSKAFGIDEYIAKISFTFKGTTGDVLYGTDVSFDNENMINADNIYRWGDEYEFTGNEQLTSIKYFFTLKPSKASAVEDGETIIINENKNATVRELKFPSGEIEMKVNKRDWEGDEQYTNYASSDGYSINVEGIEYGTTTYGTLRKEKFKITGADFKGSTLEGVKAGDVEVRPVLYFKNDGDRSYTNWDITMSSVNGLSMYFSEVYNQEDGEPIGKCLTDDAIIENICIEVFIKGTAAGIDNLPVDTTFIINPADVPTYEIPFSKDEHILKVQDAEWGKEAEGEKFSKYAQVWEEVTDVKDIEIGTTTYGQVKDAKFAVTGIDFKDCSLGTDVKAEDVQVTVYVKFADKVENPTKVIFFKKFGSMSSSTIGGLLSSLRREDNEGAETQDIPGDNYVITQIGYELFINGNLYKIDSMENGAEVIINKAPAEEKPAEETPKDDENETVPAPTPAAGGNKHQGMGMTPVIINQKSAPAASAGEAAASGSTSVTLGDSTTVSKDVIDSVSGKDSVEFKLANGASWEIAGADAAKTEGMDLGIVLDTKTATAAQLEEVAKDNDTFQFSLNFSGDFGFSAVINIPVAAKYNGQYANLYWFHGGKFEFVGSSKVEGGIADFTMKHASDYVIVFDDEAYGEDVSSGAGVYEEESETSAPAAVVVTFAALAVSAVILKKRVF